MAMLRLPHENQLQGHTERSKEKWEVGTEETNVHILGSRWRKFKTYTEQEEAIVLVREMQRCTGAFFSSVFFGNESERKPLKRKMEMDVVFTMSEATWFIYLILTIK